MNGEKGKRISDSASCGAGCGQSDQEAAVWRISDDFPENPPILPAEVCILLKLLPESLLNELVNGDPCVIIEEDNRERIGK